MVKAKTIWLRKETYDRLDACRGKRETFSECVNRLIDLWETMNTVSQTLGPSHYLKERPVVDARAKETLDLGDRTPKLPYKDK